MGLVTEAGGRRRRQPRLENHRRPSRAAMEALGSHDQAVAVILEDIRAKAHQQLGPTKAPTCIRAILSSRTGGRLLRTRKRLEHSVRHRVPMAIGKIATFTVDRRMHRRRIPVGIVRSILGTAEEQLGNNTTMTACTTTTPCHNMGPMATVHTGEDIPSSGTCQPGEIRASRTRPSFRNKGALESLRISSQHCQPQRFSLLV